MSTPERHPGCLLEPEDHSRVSAVFMSAVAGAAYSIEKLSLYDSSMLVFYQLDYKACLLISDHSTSGVGEKPHLLAQILQRVNKKTILQNQQYSLTIDKQKPDFVTALLREDDL